MDEDEDVAVELDSKEKKEMFETFWDYVEDKLLPP